MANRLNRQFVLAARPAGGATLGDFELSDFKLVESDIPVANDGEVLIRNKLVSVDPYQRNLMGNAASELSPIDIGRPMSAPTVAVVEQSRHDDFAVGDHVVSWSGWQDYAISDGAGLRKIDPRSAPLSTALGVLGHTGLTAWVGSTKMMDQMPGGTFVVTNAAGSVGSLASQIAKLRGYRVVGIAGGSRKVAFLREELGLDEALDYKADDFEARLRGALPGGIDRLLDSVGDYMFEALMPYFNKNAQIVTLGQIGSYGDSALKNGPDRLPELINLFVYRSIEIRGFAVTQHLDSYPEFLAEVTSWLSEGKIKYREEIVEGFEKLPGSLKRLFEGGNDGKLIVRID